MRRRQAGDPHRPARAADPPWRPRRRHVRERPECDIRPPAADDPRRAGWLHDRSRPHLPERSAARALRTLCPAARRADRHRRPDRGVTAQARIDRLLTGKRTGARDFCRTADRPVLADAGGQQPLSPTGCRAALTGCKRCLLRVCGALAAAAGGRRLERRLRDRGAGHRRHAAAGRHLLFASFPCWRTPAICRAPPS